MGIIMHSIAWIVLAMADAGPWQMLCVGSYRMRKVLAHATCILASGRTQGHILWQQCSVGC